MAENLVEIYTNCYGRYGLQAALELVPQLGLRHIEMATRPHRGVLEVPAEVVAMVPMPPEGVERLRAALAAHGVTASSLGGGERALDEEGMARMRARVDLAATLGARVIVGSYGDPATEEDRRRLYDRLLELADYAGRHDVTFAIETHPGLTVNARETLRTMRDLGHPRIRINFDTANILYYNEGANVADELRAVAQYVAHVHLKDSRGGYREWYFPALGDGGAVDFALVGKILDDAGFFGPYSIEIEGIRGEPEQTLEQRQERLRRSVDHLRRIGFLSPAS